MSWLTFIPFFAVIRLLLPVILVNGSLDVIRKASLNENAVKFELETSGGTSVDYTPAGLRVPPARLDLPLKALYQEPVSSGAFLLSDELNRLSIQEMSRTAKLQDWEELVRNKPRTSDQALRIKDEALDKLITAQEALENSARELLNLRTELVFVLWTHEANKQKASVLFRVERSKIRARLGTPSEESRPLLKGSSDGIELAAPGAKKDQPLFKNFHLTSRFLQKKLTSMIPSHWLGSEEEIFLRKLKNANLSLLERVNIFKLYEFQKAGLALSPNKRAILDKVSNQKPIEGFFREEVLSKIGPQTFYTQAVNTLEKVKNELGSIPLEEQKQIMEALEALHHKLSQAISWTAQEIRLLSKLKLGEDLDSENKMTLAQLTLNHVQRNVEILRQKALIAGDTYSQNLLVAEQNLPISSVNAWSFEHPSARGSKSPGSSRIDDVQANSVVFSRAREFDKQLYTLKHLIRETPPEINLLTKKLYEGALLGSLRWKELNIIRNLRPDEMKLLIDLLTLGPLETPTVSIGPERAKRIGSILKRGNQRRLLGLEYSPEEVQRFYDIARSAAEIQSEKTLQIQEAVLSANKIKRQYQVNFDSFFDTKTNRFLEEEEKEKERSLIKQALSAWAPASFSP